MRHRARKHERQRRSSRSSNCIDWIVLREALHGHCAEEDIDYHLWSGLWSEECLFLEYHKIIGGCTMMTVLYGGSEFEEQHQ